MTRTGTRQIADIPDGWRMMRLADVAEVIGGSTPSRRESKYWNGDIPWVVPSELTELPGRYLSATEEEITEDGMRAAGLKLIPAGSVLVTSRATIGATAINAMPLVTNQGFQSLVAKRKINSLWLYYWISGQKNELNRRASGSTFLEISRVNVRSLPILLPPLPEQQAIAEILDSIDDAIESSEAATAATEQLRDSLLHELLTRGVPGWHTEWKQARGIGEIPADWRVARLGEVSEVKTGGTPKRSEPTYWDGHIPWMSSGEVNQRCLTHTAEQITQAGFDNSSAKLFPSGTVMVAMNGQGTTRGKVCLLGIDASCNQSLAAILAKDDLAISFLFHVMESAYKRLRSLTGEGRNGLNLGLLRSFLIPLPTLQEQQTIAAMLDSVDAAVERSREERDMLESLKASTADALLTGRTRVGSTR